MESFGEGGAEQNLLTLFRHFPAADVRNSVAWLYDNETLLDAFRPYAVDLVPLRATRGLGLVAAALRLAAYLRRQRPDLIHVQLIRPQFVARLAARLAGNIPVITTWQCLSYGPDMYAEMGKKGPVLRELTRLLDALSGLGDKQFLAVSQAVADHNAQKLWIPPRRVTVVHNTFEPSRTETADVSHVTSLRNHEGLADNFPVLLAVGRLVEQKSHDTLLDAMPEIVRSFPKAMLLIAGQGPLEAPLQAQIRRLGLESHVRLLGRRNDVPLLLRLADVFVLPSISEGLSIALLEAVAAGLPVVVSRIPMSTEVTDGSPSAAHFEPRDAAGLAQAVASLMKNAPLVRAEAAKVAGLVRERFAPQTIAARFLEVAFAASLPLRFAPSTCLIGPN